MTVEELKKKWKDISSFQDKIGYKALRINSDCLPDLFIATDETGFRCLLLFIPNNIEVKLNATNKQQLLLEYIKDKNIVIIKLLNFDYLDLFNDLILSLYDKINNIADPGQYSKELVIAFYKWAEFFEDKIDSKLSFEEIKGLFGELFILREMINKCLDINSLLLSWRGPYDSSNDFVLDNKNIEVKTRDESKSTVRISSEFQLEKEFGKGLELIVVTVKINLLNGISIYDLLLELAYLIRNLSGDLSILYKAIRQKGLTVDSSKDYNNNRFEVVQTNTFDCNLPGFPKLSMSDIPNGITQLNYNLRVSSLNSYLINEKKYNL
jgi:hypothetical protein